MGGVDGKAGAWAYAEGGMGGVSASICSSARALGAQVFTEMVLMLKTIYYAQVFLFPFKTMVSILGSIEDSL